MLMCLLDYLFVLFFLVFKLSVRYYGADKKELDTARLYLTAVGESNQQRTKIIIVV